MLIEVEGAKRLIKFEVNVEAIKMSNRVDSSNCMRIYQLRDLFSSSSIPMRPCVTKCAFLWFKIYEIALLMLVISKF